MVKMEPTFPEETRNLRRNRDLRKLIWDYVIETYQEAERTRLTAKSSASTVLATIGPVRKSRNNRSSRQDRNQSRPYNRTRSPKSQTRTGSQSRSHSRDCHPSQRKPICYF